MLGGGGWNWVLCSEDKDMEKGAASGGGGRGLGAVL